MSNGFFLTQFQSAQQVNQIPQFKQHQGPAFGALAPQPIGFPAARLPGAQPS
jgi:hypothetical protein